MKPKVNLTPSRIDRRQNSSFKKQQSTDRATIKDDIKKTVNDYLNQSHNLANRDSENLIKNDF